MKKYLLGLALTFLTLYCNGQNIVTDSVFINFKPDTLLPFKLNFSSINDNRTGSPKFVSYAIKKKFLLLPVDQEISTKQNLATELLNSFSNASGTGPDYSLEIDYFLIERYNGRFFNPYILRADLPLYQNVDTNKNYIGTLSYNFEFKPFSKRTPKTETYEVMLSKWHTQFKLDLLGADAYQQHGAIKPNRLIKNKLKRPYFLHINLGGVIGYNFYQLEGELFFTRPENEESKWFLSNIVRYQNNRDFEMIGFGKKSEHFNKRLNDKMSLDITSNFLIGLNKWKIKEDKTLYHLMNFSFSSNQSICLNKKNVSGWKLNVGLYENLYYIIKMKLKFQGGLYLSIGYKF